MLERLEPEHNNMRRRSLGLLGGESELGLRLAGALWRFWWMEGYSRGQEVARGDTGRDEERRRHG